MERRIPTLALIIVIAIALLLILIIPANAEPLACSGGFCYHLPMIGNVRTTFYLPIVFNQRDLVDSPLIINHTNVNISQIPDYWLNKAKEIMFHYGHTSHGSQITTGLQYLEGQDSKYSMTNWNLGNWNSHLSDGLLPITTSSLNIYDGNYDPYGLDDYIEPGDYWDGAAGQTRTATTAASGNFDYSMWSWCGQADTSDISYINSYLVQMSAFETAFPDMRFILMTGHNVSKYANDNLLARNQQMRDYALAHNMILFDFADIETHDPDGNYYDPDIWDYGSGDTGSCPWCDSYCASHPSYCIDLPSDCAHTYFEDGGLFCKMKAQAFWWMMARLAGWSGNP